MRRSSRAGSALVLVLTMAGTALAQTSGTDADLTRPWWGWVLLGRLHPLVVHFPIGLILAGAAFELVQWVRRRPVPTDVGSFCLGVGLLTGAIAVWFGTLNADHQSITGESAVILERHRYGGWALLGAAAAALLAGRVTRARGALATGPAGTYALLVGVSAMLVGVTGHFGGQLVYGSTYVTSVLPWNRTEVPPVAAQLPVGSAVPESSAPASGAPLPEDPAPSATTMSGMAGGGPGPSAELAAPATPAPTAPTPAPPPAPAPTGTTAAATLATADPVRPAEPPAVDEPAPSPVIEASAPLASASTQAPGRIDFARQVEPIFRNTCVECHGPEKVKARLRMDSVAGLQAGGKNGALFVPGDPDASLLMRRVLGLDGEDQMPLDNDPLTADQLETLRQWILQGARYDARVTSDSQPEP
jgi:uncharacterized membrane protein